MDAKVVYKKLSVPASTSEKVAAPEGWEPNHIELNKSTGNLVINDPGKSSQRRRMAFILVPIIAVAVAVVAVSLIWHYIALKTDHTRLCGTEFSTEKPEVMSHDLGNNIHILTRTRWGGRDISNGYQNRTLVHPIKLVIIGHTATPMCMNLTQCARRLQSLQSSHVSEWGYVDIGYNFLVGGDGNIYQALGWDIQNYLRNNSIQIQFVGSYDLDEVLDRQRTAAQALLKRGVELGKLDKEYLLVGHNQIENTESPGASLKKDINSWPHYYSGKVA